MNQTRAWILATRPKTLTAAVVPVLGAWACTIQNSEVRIWIFPVVLLSAMTIQIATNLFNDAIDFEKGADSSTRLGPKRMAQTGHLSVNTLYRAATMMLAFAFLLGIPLVVIGGWPIVAIGLASLFLAYAYTGGPFPLAYWGLGDLFVVIFFGLIAVSATNYLASGEWTLNSVILGLQVGLLSTGLIAINNARDFAQDRLVGKWTWAARFGLTFSRVEITCIYLLAFILNLYWLSRGFAWAAGLSTLAIIPAALVITGVWRNEPGEIYNSLLARAAATHLMFGLLFGWGSFWA